MAYGETTIIGTRNPSSTSSIVGGATWSYSPPHSSQVMKIAIDSHIDERMMPFTMSVTQLCACRVLNGG